jgi:thymidylate synthase
MKIPSTTPTDAVWISHLGSVLTNGAVISPRGISTKEFISNRIVTGLSQPIITVAERELSYKFMAAEAAWILSGGSFVEEIAPYAPSIAKFSDDGITFRGAYGPKVVEQIGYIVDTLVADQESRQAVMTIWRERPAPSKDIPCTVSVQFFIRNGMLYCIDNMRSSDLWLGYPYDIFNFSMLSLSIRNHVSARLNTQIGMGAMILNAGSSHLYERNWAKSHEIFMRYHHLLNNPDKQIVTHMVPDHLYEATHVELIEWLAERAEEGDLLEQFSVITSDEETVH